MVRDSEGMRRSQLAHSVKNGRLVTFFVFDADDFCGYIGGWDDTSWFVLEPNERGFIKRIVSKGSVSMLTLHDKSTYEDEPTYEEMERIVAPFREVVLQEVFGHARPATRKAG